MASEIQQVPFVKQLGSSDRPTRDKALTSLQTYLTSNHTFTELELLKLWKGLFFCMWHSDRPLPQQRLALALSHLLLPLPRSIFTPFLAAFWTTISREWTSIDVLRMDKFLRLVRCYINATLVYLARQAWETTLVQEYLRLIEEIPLSPGNMKVPDGLRYHVLDVWVDELDRVDEGREGVCPVEEILGSVRRLATEGKTKAVRKRAKETLADERLVSWNERERKDIEGDKGFGGEEGEEDEWDGLGE